MMLMVLVSMMHRRTLRTNNSMLVSRIKHFRFMRSAETNYNVRKLENTLHYSPVMSIGTKNKSDFIQF